MIRSIYARVRSFPTLVRALRLVTGARVKNFTLFSDLTAGKRGLEIGGPSGVFSDSGILPIYRRVGSLDNAVYSAESVNPIDSAGPDFHYHPMRPIGRNFIREGTDLHDLGSYDFVLSCHSLEHIANPIKALKEWMRLAPSAIIVLPHHRYTFEHRRPPTPVAHMLRDFYDDTGEDDLTHRAEMLTYCDYSKAGMTREAIESQTANNFRTRCIHHHAFDEHNSRDLMEAAGCPVLTHEFVRPYHIVLLATSPRTNS